MDHDARTGQESAEDVEERRQQKLRGLKGSQPSTSVSSSSGPTLPGPASARLDYHSETGQESAEDVEERRQQKFKGVQGSQFSTPISSSYAQNLSGPAFGGLGDLQVPYRPARELLESSVRYALAKGLPTEVWCEVATVRNEYEQQILRSALNCSNFDTQARDILQRALEPAARSGLVATMTWLLGYLNLNEGKVTYPAFYAVVRVGNKAIVELLLEHQPDILQHYGTDALRIAARGGHKAVVELLLELQPDILQHHGVDTLIVAAKQGHKAVVELLLEHQPDILQHYGRGALRVAAEQGHKAVVELLLERRPDILQHHGTDTLRVAAEQGHKAVVELLLEHQPDILQKHGTNALIIVVEKGSEEILRLLLENGVDVNAQGGISAFTALHKAVCAANWGMMDILLKGGADPFLKDGEGNTAKDWAKRFGYQAFERRLIQAEKTWVGQGTTLDIMPAKRATHAENSAKVKESSKEWTKASIIRHGQGAIDSLEPSQDDSVLNTKHFQPITPASQPTVNAFSHFQALSIRGAIGVEEELDCQDDNESIDTLSSIDYDSLLDECIDEAEEEPGSQWSVVEHEILSETIESSESPNADATDSIEDEAEGCDFRAAIDLEMQHALEVLMTEFYAVYENWCIDAHDGENSSVQPQQKISSSGHDLQASPSYGYASRASNGRLGRGKRLAQDQNSDGEGGDEDGKKRPKRQKDSKNEEFALLFACPYYKRDPAAHCKIGSCTGPGFRSVTRVKEHLYRRHLSPPQCARCGESFNEQEELDSHARNDIQCERSEMIVFEGISPRKLKLLKCKKKNEDDPSEEGRWRDVFRILFPGAPIPNPYFEVPSQIIESQHLPTTEAPQAESFEQFSNARLPGLVEARLFDAIRERYKQVVEEELKHALPEIIKISVSDLLQAWKRSNPSESMRPGVAPSEAPLLPSNAPTETISNMEHCTSLSNDATFSTLPVSNPTSAFMPQKTVHNPLGPSDSSYTNVQDYHYPTDTPLDTIPEFSNLPTMLSTFTDAPDLWPSLPLQSDTSFPQNRTWGGNFDPSEPIGKGKGREEHAVDTFSWDL